MRTTIAVLAIIFISAAFGSRTAVGTTKFAKPGTYVDVRRQFGLVRQQQPFWKLLGSMGQMGGNGFGGGSFGSQMGGSGMGGGFGQSNSFGYGGQSGQPGFVGANTNPTSFVGAAQLGNTGMNQGLGNAGQQGLGGRGANQFGMGQMGQHAAAARTVAATCTAAAGRERHVRWGRACTAAKANTICPASAQS